MNDQINGLTEFLQNIEISSKLQEMLVSIIKCQDTEISEKLEEFFAFLKEINISNNLPVYEALLYSLSQFFMRFNTFTFKKGNTLQQNNYSILYTVLSELESSFSLKTIPQSMLFCIFRDNDILLLYLYKKGILPFSFLRIKYSLEYPHFTTLSFFHHEFVQNAKSFYNQQIKKINSLGKLPTINLSTRENLHSNDKISQIIRNDDIDSFLQWVARFGDFEKCINDSVDALFLDFNSKYKESSMYWRQITLLDYSILYESVNIFKYLYMNHAKLSRETLLYSIVGGNDSIFSILEEGLKIDHQMCDKFLTTAIFYQQTIFIEYFLNMKIDHQQTIQEIFSTFNKTYNFTYLAQYIKMLKENINISEYCKEILENNLTAHYLFDYFLLQQKNFDINSKNKIKQIIYGYFGFVKGISQILIIHSFI
ncbi:hypothetical protein TRFO_21552 [Tritrichomonas foetus]|uniref:DUF3447 domain-containing protein n=1 Tax=Tritrichomonas foetus TaxID=1144522 RepID=A0A1J4KI60_9EUKA|nr:hypothetical protein TRFO_21552 [Tritrichomonas foetus]|eukprot:OHT09508.1 hypothetical protein TRFO_21552 [Tritrichomonas foetus]